MAKKLWRHTYEIAESEERKITVLRLVEREAVLRNGYVRTCIFCGKQWKNRGFRRHLPGCVINNVQDALKGSYGH